MERILAMIDGDGIVKNIIVVDDTWDYGGIDTCEYAVGIGCVYDYVSKSFVNEDGSSVKLRSELEAEPAEIYNLLVTQ